jgi:hypothetical protein
MTSRATGKCFKHPLSRKSVAEIAKQMILLENTSKTWHRPKSISKDPRIDGAKASCNYL